MKTPRLKTWLPLTALTLASTFPLRAQTAQTATPVTPAASAPPITLSAFIVDVSRDRGYIAVDSLAVVIEFSSRAQQPILQRVFLAPQLVERVGL